MNSNHLTPDFDLSMDFKELLISWYSRNKRKMPWRSHPSPYSVWLSEIILQQTRVEQGTPYFERFILNYPDVQTLASAPESDVLKLWQGLGYYSRARNLHAAARQVVNDFDGVFPKSYSKLLKLKGVGSYSAAAIASICYNEPVAVVDGNVYRFLGRFLGIATPIDTAAGKREFNNRANELMDRSRPGDFNQAMMEFGSLVCTPRNPKCNECPFSESCVAFKSDATTDFPVKSKKTKSEALHIHYFVIRHEGGIYLQQRSANGIWGNMYEFPSVSDSQPVSENKVAEAAAAYGLSESDKHYQSPPVKHLLSHRKLTIHFLEFQPKNYSPQAQMKLVRQPAELDQLALPKPIERHIAESIFRNEE